MRATPDVFAHLTHLLMNLAGGKVCAVLEVRPQRYVPDVPPCCRRNMWLEHIVLCFQGRIQLDFPPPVGVSDSSDFARRPGAATCEPRWSLYEVGLGSGTSSARVFFVTVMNELVSIFSALESLHCVRAAHRQYWSCLKHAGITPTLFFFSFFIYSLNIPSH